MVKKMEYINDININEAVIHILDSNAEEPVLNEYSIDLDEDIFIIGNRENEASKIGGSL